MSSFAGKCVGHRMCYLQWVTVRQKMYLLCTVYTEKYSPKSYVINFHMQMSSSQWEEQRWFSHMKKNDTFNKNRERCFFTCEKNDTSNQKPQRCVSLVPKFLPFIGACSFADMQWEKFFSKSFSSKKSEKHPGNLSGIVLFVSLSMKKTVESWENKRKGKNWTRHKLKLC